MVACYFYLFSYQEVFSLVDNSINLRGSRFACFLGFVVLRFLRNVRGYGLNGQMALSGAVFRRY
jgi:hypothetical protein